MYVSSVLAVCCNPNPLCSHERTANPYLLRMQRQMPSLPVCALQDIQIYSDQALLQRGLHQGGCERWKFLKRKVSLPRGRQHRRETRHVLEPLRISPRQACEDFNAPSARPSMGNSDVRCFAPEWSGLADSVTHRQRATKRYLVPFHLPGMPTTVCSGREAKHLAVPTTPRSTLRPPPAANKALCCCLANALAASVVVLRHANILHAKKWVESKTRNCGEKKRG